MEKSINRTTRWVAFATLLSPAAICWADFPTLPAEETTAVVANVEESTTADASAVNNKTLFKHASYPAAWTAAQETNKPILVYVTMPQCPHCTKMIEQTYEQPEVDEMVKGSFETLQAGRYTDAILVSKLHVRWYPTTVLVGSNNKVLDVIEGYVDAKTFKRRLQLGIASASSSTQTRK
jgi:thioredoxin-related protein